MDRDSVDGPRIRTCNRCKAPRALALAAASLIPVTRFLGLYYLSLSVCFLFWTCVLCSGFINRGFVREVNLPHTILIVIGCHVEVHLFIGRNLLLQCVPWHNKKGVKLKHVILELAHNIRLIRKQPYEGT